MAIDTQEMEQLDGRTNKEPMMHFTVRATSAIFCLLASLSCFGQSYNGTNLGPIPDGTAAQLESYGASRDVYFDVSPLRTVTAVTVSFAATHTWVSDLRVRLIAPNGNSHLLFARTGQTPQDADGFSSDLNGTYTFTDSPTAANWWTGASSNPVPSGSYRTVNSGGPDATNPPPVTSLNAQFNGTPANGRWILRFDDGFIDDTGAVTSATLNLTLAGSTVRVFNDNDSGSGSLRNAIQNAESGDLIRFETPFFSGARTINLLTPLVINKAIAIQGRGADRLTLRRGLAAGDMRIFTIGAGSGTVSLSGMTVRGGELRSVGDGGGIFSERALMLSGMHVTGNFASGRGGGVYLAGGGQIINSTISGNRSSTGGGLYQRAIDGRAVQILGSTVSGNQASSGGGLLVSSDSGTAARLELINSTIVNNNATSGSGGGVNLSALGSATILASLGNTIVANNTGRNFFIFSEQQASFRSLGFNLSDNYGGVFDTIPSDRQGNPKLGPLAPHGGSTPTHTLLGGSSAIDSGGNFGFTPDQRGALRPFGQAGSSPDIGAVEMQVITVTNSNDSGAGSLRAALTTANANGTGLDDIIFDATEFSSARNINLSSALPDINSAVTINGVGADLLRIVRGGGAEQFRIFTVNPMLEIAAFSGMKIQSGTVTNGSGGGILSRSPLTLAAVHVLGNIARDGAGVTLEGAGGTILNSTFNGNTSIGRPAGIYLLNGGLLPLRIVNSTISDNSAQGSDGGIFNLANNNSTSRLEVVNSTISNNTSTITGGIASVSLGGIEASTEIRNSIIAGNTINNLGSFASTGTATIESFGFNLSDSADAAFLNRSSDRNSANPGLAPLALNGGPTPTRRLGPDSDALDVGNNTGSGFLFDQRGPAFLRPIDVPPLNFINDGADIGALELRPDIFSSRFEEN